MDYSRTLLTLIICNVGVIFLFVGTVASRRRSSGATKSRIKFKVATLRRLVGNQHGATAVEYGLICALMVIVMVIGLKSLANSTISMWGNVSSNVLAVAPT
jgi:pilus assembly protein Flp/PilA